MLCIENNLGPNFKELPQIPITHPWLYHKFVTYGFHSIHWCNRFWGGLPTDLVIEQTMMWSVKSPSGLTHGSGVTKLVRHTGIHSMHKCASLHLALKSSVRLHQEDMTHIDCEIKQIKRDHNDLNKVLDWPHWKWMIPHRQHWSLV